MRPEKMAAQAQAPTSSRHLIGACFWVTTRCNLSCGICYADLYSEPDNTLDGYCDLLDRLAKFGLRKVAFTGGDPLIIRSLPQIVAHAKRLGLRTAVTTNGKLLTAELIEALSESLDELTLPFEGASEEVASIHRTSSHRHGHVLELLNNGRRAAIALDVSTVVTQFNVGDLCATGRHLEDLGVAKWKVFQYSQLNASERDAARFTVDDSRFAAAVEELNIERTSHGWAIEVDIRQSDPASINSYLNVLPQGSVLVSDGSTYTRLGRLQDCETTEDLVSMLLRTDFSFDKHMGRHRRDAESPLAAATPVTLRPR